VFRKIELSDITLFKYLQFSFIGRIELCIAGTEGRVISFFMGICLLNANFKVDVVRHKRSSVKLDYVARRLNAFAEPYDDLKFILHKIIKWLVIGTYQHRKLISYRTV